jgi:insecticidal toxin complex protein TccC
MLRIEGDREMDLTVHRNTSSITANDGRGLAVRHVAYLRNSAREPLEALITRQRHDVTGRPVEHWDPRLYGSRPTLTTVHGLTGQPLKVDSVDSGWRLSLLGVAGEVLCRWDERGNQWRNTYDDQLRMLAVDANAQPNVEVLTYGRGDADPGKNLRGQLIKKVDPSGSIAFDSFSLHYLPLEETRTLFDGCVYTTRWRYGADGKALSQTDAGNHQQHSRYDVAGQLKQVTLQINASDSAQDILKNAQYNAAGQVIEQQLGNGMTRTWIYDQADGRLTRMKAGVPGQNLRQDLEYDYDKVGNVLSIKDHTFNPVFLANQYIDGAREFIYDPLYRLVSATGHDSPPPSSMPGRPLPNDPNNFLKYTQTFEYDTGNNLIKITHSRAVRGYTHRMRIDPSSNRGVRWKEGDPEPDFSKLFDRHGNLQALQPGQALQWNSHDELASITLIERENGLHDTETFRYSNGVRVYKRHETHTSSTSHFHEVRYLPGLEIRCRDTGEELHVITLPNVIGNVRCLHWLQGKPEDIDANQVRYCLDDSLGSSLIELDQAGRLISHEDYYPFGGTASLRADSVREVSYKTIRYSGKERDDSGLYYYGRRYFASWLQRWISADPAGTVDGLNLYEMVGSNPMSFVDRLGLTKGAALNQRVSARTTAMLEVPRTHPVPKVKGSATKQLAASEEHFKTHPDARFSKTFRSEVAVAHAGVAIEGSTPDDAIYITDFFNIPLERNITLTKAKHGVEMHRQADDSLGRDNPVTGGILRFTAPDRYTEYLSNRYIERIKDPALPVKIYRGTTSETIDLAGIEYEQTPLHPLIKNRIQGHIAASEGDLPQSSGLPAAHAEVQAANLALYIQKAQTGTTDPALIQVVTQKLQGAIAAQAFPACFNCTHILLESYDNTSAFDVLTGRTATTRSQWNSAIVEYR